MSVKHYNRFISSASAGKALDDVFIIDSHVHSCAFGVMHCPQATWEDILRVMDRMGINVSVVNGITNPNYQQENDKVGQLIKHYPDRVIGAMAINPMYQKDINEEMIRCYEDLGFRGIKIHELVQQQDFSYTYTPAFLDPILEFANSYECPILFHGLINESMVKSHPRASFICAHGPMNIEMSRNLAKYDNFYVDTAYTVTLAGVFEYLVEILGAERVLFGSDAPINPMSVRLAQLLSARIPDADLEKILGQNAARLYQFKLP